MPSMSCFPYTPSLSLALHYELNHKSHIELYAGKHKSAKGSLVSRWPKCWIMGWFHRRMVLLLISHLSLKTNIHHVWHIYHSFEIVALGRLGCSQIVVKLRSRLMFKIPYGWFPRSHYSEGDISVPTTVGQDRTLPKSNKNKLFSRGSRWVIHVLIWI